MLPDDIKFAHSSLMAWGVGGIGIDMLVPGNCFLADLAVSFLCVESSKFVFSPLSETNYFNICPLLLPEIPGMFFSKFGPHQFFIIGYCCM